MSYGVYRRRWQQPRRTRFVPGARSATPLTGGSVASTTSFSCNLTADYRFTGNVALATSMSAVKIKPLLGLQGGSVAVAAAATYALTLRSNRRLPASVAASTTVSANMVVRYKMAGTVAAATTLSIDPNSPYLRQRVTMTGSVAISSTITGKIAENVLLLTPVVEPVLVVTAAVGGTLTLTPYPTADGLTLTPN